MASLLELEKDPRLFLYTSLTSGSSNVVTATSRMELILKANKLPFLAIDIATDEKARKLWQRRGAKKKLPGLVKEGYVIGDIDDVEEWNEFGELRENVGPVPASNAAPSGSSRQGLNIAATMPGTEGLEAPGGSLLGTVPTKSSQPQGIALPGMAEVAAKKKAKDEAKAAEAKKELPKEEPPKEEAAKPETTASKPDSAEEASKLPEGAEEASKPVAGAEPAKDEAAKAEPTSSKAESTEEATDPTTDAKDHPTLEHLSAAASALQSEAAPPAETATSANATSELPPRPSLTSPIEEDAAKALESTESRTAEALIDGPSIHKPDHDTTAKTAEEVKETTKAEPIDPEVKAVGETGPSKDSDEAVVSKGVEDVKLEDHEKGAEKTQSQAAKSAPDATTSVED